jgi:hypothetical protein
VKVQGEKVVECDDKKIEEKWELMKVVNLC